LGEGLGRGADSRRGLGEELAVVKIGVRGEGLEILHPIFIIIRYICDQIL